MQAKTKRKPEELALEQAAKYICNLLGGLCPLVVEEHRCRTPCDLDTLPWQCWIDYFQAATASRQKADTAEVAAEAA
jgi:hypothetical protein